MPIRLKPFSSLLVVLMAMTSAAPAWAGVFDIDGDGHTAGEIDIDRQLSGVVSPFFNESGSCSDASGVLVPASTTNSLANRALPAGHQVRGPWGDFFGRNYSDVSASMVWWTVPMSGGKQVKVHERALPAFNEVADNLAGEAAKGRNYTARLVGSWVWRRIGGRYRMSTHAFGTTIDINWDTNPFKSGDDLVTDMPNWYVNAWEDAGFCWGGRWSTSKDPMHFSWKGPIATPGYGSAPPPYARKTSRSDYTDQVFSRKADFGAASGVSTYHWADGSRDGVADLYRARSWGASSTLLEVVQAAHSFKWCSIRSYVVPDADFSSPATVIISDVDGDSRPEMTLFDSKDGNVRLTAYTYVSQYSDRVRKKSGHPHLDGQTYLFGDRDRDGFPDLHVIDPGADTKISVYSASSGFKDLIAERNVAKSTKSAAWQFDLGDLDADGIPDVFAIDPRGDDVDLYVFDGASEFGGGPTKFKTRAPGDTDGNYGITDWDGDGRPDLATHRANHAVKIHLGGNQGGNIDFWFKTPDTGCPGSGSSIETDFNGDRRSDLLVGVTGEKIQGVRGRGAAAVVYSDRSGPDGTFKDQLWGPETAHDDNGAGVSDFGQAVVSGDFNDDGFQDAAIGSPGDTVSGRPAAGSVVVLYGTENGLKKANSQRWDQDTKGVKGSPLADARYGHALASGDFNDDGYFDLAIGAPGHPAGGHPDAGKVYVLYGSVAGLRARGDQMWSRRSPGVVGKAGDSDKFGSVLATGDFDDDGRSDLAVGVPLDDIGNATDAGSVTILLGALNGLKAGGSQLWSQKSPNIPGAVEAGDRFGADVAAGDFDGDSKSDLAIGVPREDGGGSKNSGKLNVLYGSNSGLGAGRAQIWSQESPGIVGSSQQGDEFGFAVTAGDFNSDGYSELAVGVPGENGDSGQLRVLIGSSGGLGSKGDQRWSEASAGVPGAKEEGDRFAARLQAADFDGDGYKDLAVSIPGQSIKDNANAGKVLIMFGSASGITASGSNGIHQASAGVKDTPEAGDRFGRLP